MTLNEKVVVNGDIENTKPTNAGIELSTYSSTPELALNSTIQGPPCNNEALPSEVKLG
jgi:hypothetical protein